MPKMTLTPLRIKTAMVVDRVLQYPRVALDHLALGGRLPPQVLGRPPPQVSDLLKVPLVLQHRKEAQVQVTLKAKPVKQQLPHQLEQVTTLPPNRKDLHRDRTHHTPSPHLRQTLRSNLTETQSIIK